jgi:hypothetical protein
VSEIKIIDIITVIKSILSGLTVQRVLNNRLGLDENEVPYYLYLLNLNFGGSEAKKEIFLNKFKQLASDLKRKPKTIKKLIVSANWRPTLVGNAVAILLKENKFHDNMIWRLENRSWVAPQLAVGIALLDKGTGEKKLQKIISDATEESNPKAIISAYSSLKFLESKSANEFEQTKLYEMLKEKDRWDDSIRIATEHWNFWKNTKPIN